MVDISKLFIHRIGELTFEYYNEHKENKKNKFIQFVNKQNITIYDPSEILNPITNILQRILPNSSLSKNINELGPLIADQDFTKFLNGYNFGKIAIEYYDTHKNKHRKYDDFCGYFESVCISNIKPYNISVEYLAKLHSTTETASELYQLYKANKQDRQQK